jgi:hypothetical protein
MHLDIHCTEMHDNINEFRKSQNNLKFETDVFFLKKVSDSR